jgi:sugar lactone lactonase YvrE
MACRGTVAEVRQLLDGLSFGESLRWHQDRLWLADWGAQEVVAVDGEGRPEVMARVGFPAFPMCAAFPIAADGSLAQPRVWADLGDGVPDGICLDAQGAIWYADVPNKQCVRVREGGGVLQTIRLDRGCFSCALGGTNRATLFMVATHWRGTERMTDKSRTGQLRTARAPAAGVGWP